MNPVGLALAGAYLAFWGAMIYSLSRPVEER
jgi:hypothetical protein